MSFRILAKERMSAKEFSIMWNSIAVSKESWKELHGEFRKALIILRKEAIEQDRWKATESSIDSWMKSTSRNLRKKGFLLRLHKPVDKRKTRIRQKNVDMHECNKALLSCLTTDELEEIKRATAKEIRRAGGSKGVKEWRQTSLIE